MINDKKSGERIKFNLTSLKTHNLLRRIEYLQDEDEECLFCEEDQD